MAHIPFFLLFNEQLDYLIRVCPKLIQYAPWSIHIIALFALDEFITRDSLPGCLINQCVVYYAIYNYCGGTRIYVVANTHTMTQHTIKLHVSDYM